MTDCVVVTGARGFLGQELCRQLIGRFQLFSIQRTERPLVMKGIETIIWNQDSENLAKKIRELAPAAVIHLASHYCAEDSVTDFRYMVDASIMLTGSIMYGLRDTESRLILAGTRFQRLRNGLPINVYSALKQYQWQLAKHMTQSRCRVMQLEVGDLYGPGDKRNRIIPSLINAAKCGLDFEITAPQNLIFPVHIRDAASAFSHALELSSGLNEQVEFGVIGPDGAITVGEVCAHIRTLSNHFSCTEANSFKARSVDKWLSAPLKVAPPLSGWMPQISFARGLDELMHSTTE